jgi:hypothetical protein
MQSVTKRIAQSFVIVGLVLMIVGMIVMPTSTGTPDRTELSYDTTASSDQVDQSNGTSVDTLVSDESLVECCDATEVVREDHQLVNTTPTPLPRQYEQIYWQDSFDDPTSGWEQRFEVRRDLPVYEVRTSAVTNPRQITTVESIAWNGYDAGDYVFALPTVPLSNQSRREPGYVTPYLWDFNTSRPLPSYPYQVDVTVESKMGSQALILLDFSGDTSNVSAGHGIVVSISMKYNEYGFVDSYGFADSADYIAVWEFKGNRVWSLGCNPESLNTQNIEMSAPQIMASVVVEQTALTMRLISNDAPYVAVKCTRAHVGDATETRLLGIGAQVHHIPMPIPYTNLIRYQQVVVAKPTQQLIDESDVVVSTDAPTPYGEVCALWGDTGNYSNLETWLSNLDSACGAFGGANMMHKRVVWPAQANIFGAWRCGSDESFANFIIRPERDYAIIQIAGLEYTVFAIDRSSDTEAVGYQFIIDLIPDGYSEGYEQWNAIVQVGYYVLNDAANDFSYYISYDNDILKLSWINIPCTRTN